MRGLPPKSKSLDACYGASVVDAFSGTGTLAGALLLRGNPSDLGFSHHLAPYDRKRTGLPTAGRLKPVPPTRRRFLVSLHRATSGLRRRLKPTLLKTAPHLMARLRQVLLPGTACRAPTAKESASQALKSRRVLCARSPFGSQETRLPVLLKSKSPDARASGLLFASRFALRIESWCGRVDSNHHGIATASPSSWCVCQFRHDRAGCEASVKQSVKKIIGGFRHGVNIRASL